MTVFRDLILASGFISVAGGAQAALSICNDTEFVQSVSVGYKGDVDWVSEGWWNIQPGDCSTVVGGELTKRYYYYRAEVNGGEFPGEGYMFCTTPEVYEIVGDTDCESRGYDSEAFSEIDTGETARDFTFTMVAGDGSVPPPRGDDGPGTDDTAGLGLEICNATGDIQSVSIGYEGDQGFRSEGWWNIQPEECAVVLSGELQRRYYYYRAEVNAGPFEGEGYMFCTTPEVYEIDGDSDCEARGYDTESFSEIDTGPTARGHTFYITADGAAPPPPQDDGPALSEGGAGLEVCNRTAEIQAVTFGYEGAEDWTSEGWWNVEPGQCVTPALDGVNRRYLYYRAEVDGGEFQGQNYFFCTTPEAFEIVGDTECEARGYDREDYREIDTGGTTGTYTLALTDDSVAPAPEVPTSPEDDRPSFPAPDSEPVLGVDDPAPDALPDGTPEEPSFDFGLPDDAPAAPEMDAVEDAPDLPETDTAETPEADMPPTEPDFGPADDTPVTPPVVQPPEVAETPPSDDLPPVDIPPADNLPPVENPPDYEPPVYDEPEEDDDRPIRRGGSRGG